MARASYSIVETKLGWIGIVGSQAGLCLITWPQASSEAVADLLMLKNANIDAAAFHDLPERLRSYFRGDPVPFPDKLDLRNATPFQHATWGATRSIPYGETRSYVWVAREIGRPRAARAVGQALAVNPLPIAIPCHRVIRSNGRFGGFGAGMEMKQHLLDMENRVTTQ